MRRRRGEIAGIGGVGKRAAERGNRGRKRNGEINLGERDGIGLLMIKKEVLGSGGGGGLLRRGRGGGAFHGSGGGARVRTEA